MHIIRAQLLAIESGRDPLAIPGHAPDLLSGHLMLCGPGPMGAGFIRSGPPAILTRRGADFLAMGRDEAAWATAMAFMERANVPMTELFLRRTLTQMSQLPLFARRAELGLRLEDIGERSGLHLATISRCECQNRLPQSIVAVRSYAAALGMTEADLRALVARGQPARVVGHGRLSCPKRSPAAVRKAGRS